MPDKWLFAIGGAAGTAASTPINNYLLTDNSRVAISSLSLGFFEKEIQFPRRRVLLHLLIPRSVVLF
jgi:hypothetical protein